MSNMHIEDFKAKVAQFQVGDELKLEELCAEWNEDADLYDQGEKENMLLDQIADLNNKIEGLKEVVLSKEKVIVRLENEQKRLRGIIDKILEEG